MKKDILYLNLEGRRLAYAWSHGPVARPLVVLHGLGDSSIETYAPRFATTDLRDIPTLFIDLPGFGHGKATDAFAATIEQFSADVHRLIAHLRLESTNVFAHSMGANVAIALGRNNPEAVSHLILAEPLLDPAHSVLATGIVKFSEQSFVERRYAMLVRATRIQANRGEATALAFLPTIQMANPVTMYRTASSLVSERHPSFASMLTQLGCPVHLLVGGLTNANIDHLGLNAIPTILIANSGHTLMVEQSASTSYAILDIVNL